MGGGYPYYPWGPAWWRPVPASFYPYWGSPYFFSPFIHPGYFTGFAYQPSLGEVKLKAEQKNAAVFLNGAYAGTAGKLKSMWLEPGTYELSLQEGSWSFAQKIYVLSGKTLKIDTTKPVSEVRP